MTIVLGTLAALAAALACAGFLGLTFLGSRAGVPRGRVAPGPWKQIAGFGALGLVLVAAVAAAYSGSPMHTPWIVTAAAATLAAALALAPLWETALYGLGLLGIGALAPVVIAVGHPRGADHDLLTDAAVIATLTGLVCAGSLLVLVVARAMRPPPEPADATRSTPASRAVRTALWSGVGTALFGALFVLVSTMRGEATTPSDHLLGWDVSAPPTLMRLFFLDGRINIFFATLAALAVTAYLAAVATLRRRGDHWPVGRTIAWLIGWALVVYTTSSGLGRYAPAELSVHISVNLTLNMFAAMIMVLGGFITLLLRASRPAGRGAEPGLREWLTTSMHSGYLQFIYHPLTALITMVGTYYVLYFTSLFPLSLATHWLHQLLYVHFLVSGYLYYGLIIGVDPPPKELPHLGKLGLILGAMPFHAFFGVILLSMTTLVAEPWYRALSVGWTTRLDHDQFVAGSIAWAAGEFPLIVVLGALITQWVREDNQLARRHDRQTDSGIDDSYDAYNEMLAQLAARDSDKRQ